MYKQNQTVSGQCIEFYSGQLTVKKTTAARHSLQHTSF